MKNKLTISNFLRTENGIFIKLNNGFYMKAKIKKVMYMDAEWYKIDIKINCINSKKTILNIALNKEFINNIYMSKKQAQKDINNYQINFIKIHNRFN